MSSCDPEFPGLAEGRDAPAGWVGMKTVAQLRREQGIGAPRNPDSLYHKIERAPRKFNPLKIPRSLQVKILASSWSPTLFDYRFLFRLVI